jgi:2-polyprenyl-6-hydroxyphenyl methylase/3-demethylubiquinone-9 3-methyltransferase
VNVARLHALRAGLDVSYELTPAEELATRGERYDVVLNMEVVEHVADFPGFMAACCRLVAPGGAMFVSTINRTPLAWLFAIVGAEYVLRWLPRGTHRWALFRRPGELRAQLGAGGLRVVSESGVRVNPFTRAFALKSGLAVNYMQFAVRAPDAASGTTAGLRRRR